MPDSRNTSDAEETQSADGSMEELTPAQLADLKSRAAKADDSWERLLRATADMDNFKKRAARDKEEAIKFANESLVKKLVPVLDNFESALVAANQNPNANAQSLQAGVNMIYQQLRSALTESGLEELDSAGKPFDPNWHEAVSQKESSDVPEGQVLEQLRKGFKLRDRLIRPAMVVVAKSPSR